MVIYGGHNLDEKGLRLFLIIIVLNQKSIGNLEGNDLDRWYTTVAARLQLMLASYLVLEEQSKQPELQRSKEILLVSTIGEVRARTLFVLSSSNRGRLLGIIDLMRQKNKRMKQEGLNRQIGILQKMEFDYKLMIGKLQDKQLSAEQAYWLPILKPVYEKPPVPSEPVLKKEIPHELPSISLVKDHFQKWKVHVNKFDETITFHTKITGNRIGSLGAEHIKGAFEKYVKPFAQTLKEYFQLFEHGLYKELKDTKAIFNQMVTEVAKCFVDKKYFEIEKKELSLDNNHPLQHIICQDHENDRLMELLISQDLVHTVVNSLAAINDYKSMQQSFMDEYNETLVLKAELAKKHDMIEKAVYNELSKRCSRLKNRCISLEIKLQQNKESFQNNRPSHYQDAHEFKDFFHNK
ncbi:hypothetical protein Tco_1173122 [Tanacetum coccineum]